MLPDVIVVTLPRDSLDHSEQDKPIVAVHVFAAGLELRRALAIQRDVIAQLLQFQPVLLVLRTEDVARAAGPLKAAVLADEHGYLYKSSFARALKGWALAMTGQPADGLILVQQEMAQLDRIGANMDRPYLLALLSEITAANGRPSGALAQVTDALGLMRENRTYFYEAELYRLRGALVLQSGGRAAEDEAEANFRQALEIAGKQNAKALEPRAAVSLCRLLHARGMPQEGLKVLVPVYLWFTEGAGTADLIEAKELVTGSVHRSQSAG